MAALVAKALATEFGGQLVDKLVVSLVDKKCQIPAKTAYQAEPNRLKRQHGQ